MKFLKRIQEFLYSNRIKFLAILLFQVLALTLFTLLPILSRQDFYKDFILTEIEKETGLEVKVESSDLILFPFPGIELNSVEVRKGDLIIGISDQIKIDISWFGLLGQKVEIRDVSISGGQINLHKLKDGSIDLIEFLQKGKKDPQEDHETHTIKIFDPTSSSTGGPLNPKEVLKIGLKNIQIENFFIHYQDDTHKRTYGIYLWKSS
ncbi:AsmA family protein, partial [Leptospira yasudae]